MVKPLLTGKQAQIGIEFAQDTRQTINQWFYVTLFQILVDSGDMTATEVLQRAGRACCSRRRSAARSRSCSAR
jgi:hypothetical protein